jgi:hypothetical protein
LSSSISGTIIDCRLVYGIVLGISPATEARLFRVSCICFDIIDIISSKRLKYLEKPKKNFFFPFYKPLEVYQVN